MFRPKICPFYEKLCQETSPDNILCEEDSDQPANYEKCKFYAWLLIETTISVPLICPRHHYCDKSPRCNLQFGLAYRECEEFSEWFWETKAGKR